MRKSLTEHEQAAIKAKLIESCRACWERYGYKKTNVAEVAAMSGISTGAFYGFFASKELLFAETANTFTRKLFDIMRSCKPQEPISRDFAEGLKECADSLFENRWVFSLREDAETILRKLPPDYMERDFQGDLLDIAAVVNLYGLTPKAAPDEITAALHTLLMSVYLTDIIGAAHRQALNLLIDAAISNLFE
jgi:AcrR family transcriptional regulator